MTHVAATGDATQGAAWQALVAHRDRIAPATLRTLFAGDPGRAERFTIEAAGLYCDFSKQRIDAEALRLLLALAHERGVMRRAAAMFAGERVNTTEDRPALHVALRAPASQKIVVDGVDVVAEVHATLRRMADFCDAVRSGAWRGHGGKPIRNVVNIGIGGSDLGPEMAHEALRHVARRDPRFHFVSNIDPAHLGGVIRDLDAGETLFIVCSKTFTTLETLANARAARQWCVQQLGDERAVAHHFVAVSAHDERVLAFGIDAAHTFPLWDWVGGRYSLASAVGLSTMLAIGPTAFADFLAGFRAMDEHFIDAPPQRNLPLLMGLLAVWNNNFLGAASTTVLPYAQALRRFPAYLQQLAMESNGKRVRGDGAPVGCDTSPVYWGEPGSNAQHSFFQLLHQGTRLVPCDFIGFARPEDAPGARRDALMASMIAQAEALAFGRSADELRASGTPEALVPHLECPGNQPSTTLVAERLTPHALGALIALYEHSVFVQGAIWGIDSFDQWGVELGKQLADRVIGEISARDAPELTHDSSTNALIRHCRALRPPMP